MAWTLGGVTIHPGDEEFTESVESNYAIQKILDATVETISYFGANSDRVNLEFILLESENSGTGKSTLKTAVRANSNVNLTADTGSLGNYRILAINFARKLASNHTQPVWRCQAELIA